MPFHFLLAKIVYYRKLTIIYLLSHCFSECHAFLFLWLFLRFSLSFICKSLMWYEYMWFFFVSILLVFFPTRFWGNFIHYCFKFVFDWLVGWWGKCVCFVLPILSHFFLFSLFRLDAIYYSVFKLFTLSSTSFSFVFIRSSTLLISDIVLWAWALPVSFISRIIYNVCLVSGNNSLIYFVWFCSF